MQNTSILQGPRALPCWVWHWEWCWVSSVCSCSRRCSGNCFSQVDCDYNTEVGYIFIYSSPLWDEKLVVYCNWGSLVCLCRAINKTISMLIHLWMQGICCPEPGSAGYLVRTIRACPNGLKGAWKCLTRELFLGLDIHAMCSDRRHMVMVLEIWSWPCRPWCCLHSVLRGTASCLSGLPTATKWRRQQQMDPVQLVRYWRCGHPHSDTNGSLLQSGSECPEKSGRAVTQRLVPPTIWANFMAQQLGKSRSSRTSLGLSNLQACAGCLYTEDIWWFVTGSCDVRTSWAAALAVPFTSCHLNVPSRNGKAAEGNLFRHRSVDQAWLLPITLYLYAQLCLKTGLSMWRKQ